MARSQINQDQIGWQVFDGDNDLLQIGDVVSVKNIGWISTMIRKLSRSKDEEFSWASHSALVYGCNSKAQVIEAINPKVAIRPLEAYKGTKAKLVVFRIPQPLSVEQKEKIVAKADEYHGLRYGFLKIAAHALDGFFGGVYLFRRLARMDSYPICSWVVAYIYKRVLDYQFGVKPNAAQPDDILDHCVKADWQCVWSDSKESYRDFAKTYKIPNE